MTNKTSSEVVKIPWAFVDDENTKMLEEFIRDAYDANALDPLEDAGVIRYCTIIYDDASDEGQLILVNTRNLKPIETKNPHAKEIYNFIKEHVEELPEAVIVSV